MFLCKVLHSLSVSLFSVYYDFCFFLLSNKSHVVQAGPELLKFLPLPSRCRAYGHVQYFAVFNQMKLIQDFELMFVSSNFPFFYHPFLFATTSLLHTKAHVLTCRMLTCFCKMRRYKIYTANKNLKTHALQSKAKAQIHVFLKSYTCILPFLQTNNNISYKRN